LAILYTHAGAIAYIMSIAIHVRTRRKMSF